MTGGSACPWQAISPMSLGFLPRILQNPVADR
jgi:hypothetical protein